MEKTINSHDGVPLRYTYSKIADSAPWVAFVIPFGLKLHHAKSFFDFFAPYFNIFTWEARIILEPADYQLVNGGLSVDNHAQDLLTIMDDLELDEIILVGYCSGAGISLAAVNKQPDRFSNLVLVNGEYTLMDKPGCVTQFGSDIDNILSIASQDQDRAKLILDKIKGNINFNAKNIPDGIELPFSEVHYLHRYGVNYLSYRSCDFENLAGSVKHRTYMLAGENDAQSNVNSAKTIEQLIDNAELFIDPKGDHYEVLRPESKTLVQIWNYLSMEV